MGSAASGDRAREFVADFLTKVPVEWLIVVVVVVVEEHNGLAVGVAHALERAAVRCLTAMGHRLNDACESAGCVRCRECRWREGSGVERTVQSWSLEQCITVRVLTVVVQGAQSSEAVGVSS